MIMLGCSAILVKGTGGPMANHGTRGVTRVASDRSHTPRCMPHCCGEGREDHIIPTWPIHHQATNYRVKIFIIYKYF